MSTFGQRLKSEREKKGLTQRALASALEITPSRLNYWEKDKREPDFSNLEKIVKVLKCDANYLIGIVSETASPDNHLDQHEQKLLDDYRKLNDFGKEEANKRVRELTEVPKYVQSQTVKVACRGAGIQEIGLDIIKKLIQDAEKNKDKNIDDLF